MEMRGKREGVRGVKGEESEGGRGCEGGREREGGGVREGESEGGREGV